MQYTDLPPQIGPRCGKDFQTDSRSGSARRNDRSLLACEA